MSKNTYQITGKIIATNVSHVNKHISLTVESQDCSKLHSQEDKKKEDNISRNFITKYRFLTCVISLLILLVVLLAISLVIHAPRVIKENQLGFDYMGVIVSILSVLVTLLVAWNIWQTVDVNQRVKNIELDNERHKLELDRQVVAVKSEMRELSNETSGTRLYCDASLSYSDANISLFQNLIGISGEELNDVNKDEIIRAYRSLLLALQISTNINHNKTLAPHCLRCMDICISILERVQKGKVITKKIGQQLDDVYYEIVSSIPKKYQDGFNALRLRRLSITDSI